MPDTESEIGLFSQSLGSIVMCLPRFFPLPNLCDYLFQDNNKLIKSLHLIRQAALQNDKQWSMRHLSLVHLIKAV